MKVSVVYASMLILLFGSCEKQNLKDPVTLIFGEAYGFCAGDCAHFFEINGNNLYKDNIENYYGDKLTFDDTSMPAADYALAKDLLTNFPQYLLDHTNQTIGCPDCTDQGGIHIFYRTGLVEYFWHIDTFVDNQPVEIRDYLKQMRDVTAALKN